MIRHFPLIAACLVAGATATFAQDTFSEIGTGQYLAPLDMAPFQDDTWQGYEQEGWYVLENRTDPGAIRYYRGNVIGDVGNGRVQTNIYVRNDDGQGLAAAGLIFDFNVETSTYAAFLLDHENNPMVLLRDEDGMEPIFADADDPVGRGDGTDVLAVRFLDGRAELLLNDEPFLNLSAESGFHSYAGVIAVGTGRHGFWGFAAE